MDARQNRKDSKWLSQTEVAGHFTLGLPKRTIRICIIGHISRNFKFNAQSVLHFYQGKHVDKLIILPLAPAPS